MKKILILTMCVCIMAQMFVIGARADGGEQTNDVKNASSHQTTENGYEAYIEKYSNKGNAEESISILAGDFSFLSEDSAAGVQQYNGRNALVWESEKGYAEYSFAVNQSGLYNIGLVYSPIAHKSLDINLCFKIDGEFSYDEAENVYIEKKYNTVGEITQNKNGDDVAPKLELDTSWNTDNFRSETFDDDLAVYLESGIHTFTLSMLQEPIAIEKIVLSPVKNAISYDEYKNAHSKDLPENVKKYFEAEKIASQSMTLNLTKTDRSSSKTRPHSMTSTKLNYAGSTNWQTAGQWIEWDIDVEKSGWYNLNLRYSQSYSKGIPSARRLYINGEVPFAEAENLKFDYSEGWSLFEIKNSKGEELPVWLESGNNKIRLEVSIGDIASIIRQTENIVFELNNMYRKIIMITSSTPDTYRDYQLEKQIPDLIDTFDENAKELEEIYDYFAKLSKDANSATALKILSTQLDSFVESPSQIANRLSSYSGNIGSISAWVAELKNQPLDVDYLYISSVSSKKPKINDNFFEGIKRELIMFLNSFVSDYSAVNEEVEKDKELTVWINSGRDQAEVIKRIVDEEFNTKYDANVDFKLVSTNLIQAFLSGDSPDTMVLVSGGTPVDLAMRGALLDMKQFEDFEQATKDYQKNALTPYMYQNGCYGMPDSQAFYMMFYRKDILNDLGISVPKTWEEFIAAIEIIQRNNMAVGVPYAGIDASGAVSATIGTQNIFSALLLQNGGSYFNEELSRTALSTDIAKNTFKTWTELYSEYGLDLSYNFFNRFRSGEMPLAIELYTQYNQLSIAAPEIDGLWDMTVIPGTEKDGVIDRTQASSSTATIISSTTDNKELAWKFVKFWTSEEIQTLYAANIEAQLGVGGRFSPANMKALQNMQWTNKQAASITEQWQWIKDVNNVPGGYYVLRGIDNSFKDVVNNGTDPFRALSIWDKEMNNEIIRKREEFGLE